MSCLTEIIIIVRLCVVLTPANACGPHSASVAWHYIDFAFFVKLSLGTLGSQDRLIIIPSLRDLMKPFFFLAQEKESNTQDIKN